MHFSHSIYSTEHKKCDAEVCRDPKSKISLVLHFKCRTVFHHQNVIQMGWRYAKKKRQSACLTDKILKVLIHGKHF